MIKILVAFLIIMFVFAPSVALATPGETETTDLPIQLSGVLTQSVRNLPEFIGLFYNYALAVAGAVATVMIMVGGFLYLTAAGNKGKIDSAKRKISDALVGLLLVLGAYLILNTINPAILSMHMPSIPRVARINTEFEAATRMSYCPAGQYNLTSNDATRARQLCSDQCGGEDQVSSIALSADPRAAETGSGSIGLDTWCCLCVTGCREGQEPIPTATPETELNSWCDSRCETTHQHFQVNTGPINCCECVGETAEEFTEAGSQIACLREINPATPDQCTAHSGTNGACTRVNSPLGDDSCSWGARTCDADSDCPGPEGATGTGHCWGNRCFQTWLENGDICEDLGSDANSACQSRYCEVERGGYDYCTERCDSALSDCICDGCIGASKRCQETSECSGSGVECLESGQVTICNFP